MSTKYERVIFRVDFAANAALERAAAKAQRVEPIAPRGRLVVVNGKRYVAFSAHELLEFSSDINTSRPGHPA